ncbi:vWA domain-containing protein [Ancylobacter sp. IITR112]|uniref:vWA domain-containing protein n=1 Tax=Ancylobacter sp. IITR112 TaxID=3138073 RepID=UPI00352A0233
MRCLGIAVGLLLIGALPQQAEARDPLLIPGKTSLYQRALSRPDTPLTREPGTGATVETFPPFEIFYVYDRRNVGGKDYVEVGRSLTGGSEGWIPADKAIDWRQTIVLGFNNPANRGRTLIFKSRTDLESTLSSEDVTARIDRLRREAVMQRLPADSPVISIEPAEFVDIEREFYILPILEAQRVRLPSNGPAKLLRIASVAERAESTPAPASQEDALKNFRIGVTFVIDTTQSMQPYIDEVRRVIARLRDRIAGSPQADRFRFGLVAFRDSTRLVPELTYVTKVFLPLDEDATADKFIAAIDQVEAARISSEGFTEDSIGGVFTAADEMNWEPFGGRFIILITDAGPRQPGPEAMMGSLAAPELHALLEQQKGVALFTLHLKTANGRFDHETAEQSYRIMSSFAGAPLYFPIEGGDTGDFGRQINVLSGELERMVTDAVGGRLREAQGARNDISSSTSRAGRAMQLAYLGSVSSTRAPDVFEGWLTDRDPLERNVVPVTPYVLMSKNELSTLRDVIRKAIELGTDPMRSNRATFFQRLRESVALITRRPEAVQNAGTLGDLLGEYLQDLPYNSEIVNITPEDFRDMSPIRERQLFDALRSKVTALERIHGEAARWYPLKPGAPPGESVSVVPLTLMP